MRAILAPFGGVEPDIPECASVRPIAIPDTVIAAVALGQGIAAVATRDTTDVRDTGLVIVDPWSFAP